MKLQTAFLLKSNVSLLLLAAVIAPVQAQSGGSELDLLRSDDVLYEIGVSDEVVEQIGALRDNRAVMREAFEKFKEELRAAENEDARKEIRQRMQEEVVAGGEKFQREAIKLLTADQTKELRTVFVASRGIEALEDDRVAADLELSDDQRKQIGELIRARGDADSDEDVAAVDGKIIALLSKEQTAAWKTQAGESEQEPAVAGSDARDNGNARRAIDATEPQSGAPSVASFRANPAEPGRKIEKFSFNFRNARWDRVLQMFAEGAGLTLDMQRMPPGSLSHLDNNEYSVTKALDIINGYLIRKGYGVVQKDGFLIVVNLDEQLDQSLIPEVTVEDLKKSGDEMVVGANQIVTIRISVEGLDTGRTAEEVQFLLGPWGSMIALTQSQLLMITDVGDNLRRIVGLLETAARPDELVFKPYHLKNIDVEEAEPLLLTQFGMRQAATNVSRAAEDRGRRSRWEGGGQPSAATRSTPPTAENLQVASDARTNSLFVTGTPAQHTLVETILTAIDVGQTPDGVPLSRTGRRGKYLQVYDVTSADVREVAKTLDAIMPGVVVNEDGYHNKLHIQATEREHEEVAQLVRQLDGAGGRESVAVIPLVKMDPLQAAATLRSLFYSEGDEAPTMETDLYGRNLIVRGTPEQVEQIKTVLRELGEDGTGVRPASQGGLLRRYSLQGRDPDEFLRILQEQWTESQPNPIRIVVPSRSSPVRERRTNSGVVDETKSESDGDQPKSEDASADAGRSEFDQLKADYFTVGLTAADEDRNESFRAMSLEDIVITTLGDDLILSSEDEAALDRLEELLDSLQQTLPYRTRWTIFYLQTSDATETADMLAQLFPSSSVASTAASTGGSIFGSLANSFSGIGSSIADATGLTGLGESPQTLRIIPDVRSNSLIISGPESILQDVWAMLRVLDSSDIPESFRDMQQRTITLEYADVDKVAEIVRSVYKPLMEVQGGGRQQQGNPLAAMFGGGGGGGGGNESQQIQLTLGVDRQTSTLIVSSSQDIYDDVKFLVDTLDTKTQDANRTIRVVQLKNADPLMIQRSLTSLFPRVSASVTSSSTTGTGGASAGGGDSSGDAKQREEAARQMQQRMEMFQRMRGGGGGGGTEGGGGFGGFGGFGGGGGDRGTRGGGGRGGRRGR